MLSLHLRRPIAAALVTLPYLLWTGCRSYAPAPIDWARESADWSASATNRVPLTLAEARQVALILNPEINALRLKHLSSESQAQAAGWWEDPVMECPTDIQRTLGGAAHPWLFGTGLTFTLPLNGVPGLEKRAAQAYAQADALAVTVAERALLAEVDRLWNACRATLRCADAQNAYKARLLEREKLVRALVAAGELPKAEADRIEQTRVKISVDCACCGPDAVARRHAFKRLLGLPPEAPCEVVPDEGETPPPALAGLVPPASELDLVRHPNVQEKLVRLKAGEEELRAEIRKQYPELMIGPRYEHEDGENKIGLSFGFTLPLWNRNRKGIADAEGGRDEARMEALNAWRSLVGEWHEAQAMMEAVATKERGLRTELLPAAQAAAQRTERLFKQGEADVLALLSADETVYDLQESLIDAQTALHEARVRLELLHVPAATETPKTL